MDIMLDQIVFEERKKMSHHDFCDLASISRTLIIRIENNAYVQSI
ncbi:MAG: hypothetical protein PQJ49_00030 [Sphaerochaetaceae bacterium]|nr:hypothetical protein [Sphaerochaetaceae bacterium]